VLAGIVFALVFSICIPESRTPSHIALLVALGAGLGLIVFAPIATGLAIRDRRPQWLLRYGPRLHWYASLGMALSLGYLFADLRHGVGDDFVVVLLGTIFIGASVNVALSLAREQKK